MPQGGFACIQVGVTRETVTTGTGTAAYNLTAGLAGSEIYRYNGFNQLVLSFCNGYDVTYTYYATGLRSGKTVGGTETKFILDGGNVVAESENTTITQ